MDQTHHILLQSDAMALQGEVTNPGVVPRAIQDVFDIIEKTPDRDFLLRMSMMEIYNEVGASPGFLYHHKRFWLAVHACHV